MAQPTSKPFTEWGINLKFKELKNKLWVNVFLRVALIFIGFVAILSISNITMLVNFYTHKEKNLLREQVLRVSELDIGDTESVSSLLSQISENYNFDVEIYNSRGKILYTTAGGQMMDYFQLGNIKFDMQHETLHAKELEDLGDGIYFANAQRRFDSKEFLVCTKQLSENYTVEIRIQKELISSSAAIANEFIVIVSSVCFVLSIVWVIMFARKFSRPIVKMNEITRDMAQLNFDRRLEVSRTDEIGQLAGSINDMSDSLSAALMDLKEKNTRLKDEIEAERQLDVMRRAFVANVSHELKTPIAIISGYAEGLRLNVNEKSREQYCNTIIDESDRMNRLVLSILELSRYEAGQGEGERTSFDVSGITDNMLSRIFTGTDIKTENQIPKGTNIFADEIQIEQVLKSYLENAKAHTGQSGTVRVFAEEKDGLVRISVFNSGSRVEEEIMPHIWQSFYRGDKSHKRESSRFGLGLSIVSAIMKMHGRDCGVYNTPEGVCFWFEADKG